MTNYRVRGDGLNQPESDYPTFDTAHDERTLWKPSDNNLKAVNYAPRHIVSQSGAIPAGFYYLHRVRIPANTVITNVHAWIYAAGSGLTYAAAAVYDAAGVQLGVTASQATAWTTTGEKVMALGTPIPAQSTTRFVWVAFAAAGTTLPSFGVSSIIAAGNAGVPTTNPSAAPRNNGYLAGATPLPASGLAMLWITAWFELWTGVS